MSSSFGKSIREEEEALNMNGTMELNQDQNVKKLDVDEFLQYVGQFGKMQIILQVMFAWLMLPATFQTLLMTFVGNNPPWKCSGISAECNKTRIFTVKDDFYKQRCSMQNRTSWDFSKPKKYSIVTEWDLVCEHKELSHLANSGLFIGWAAGAIVLGYISDRFGRKSVLFPSMGMVIVAGFVSGFAHNYWLFFALRLFIGFFQGGIGLTIYVMATELVGPKYRAMSGTIIWFFFTLALCLTALKAWLLPEWRMLEIIVSAPYIFVMVFWKFIPESIRWLRLNERMDEGMDILKRIAKINRRTIPSSATLAPAKKVASHGNMLDLFRPWPMLSSTLVQCYAWFINGMVYYGISLASDDLGGNLYRDFVLTSLVEIPGNLLVIYCCNRFGRKPAVIWSMFVGGLACVGVGAIPHGEHVAARVSLGMLGKLCITLSFNSIYVWSVELYPTIVRSQGMGLLSVVSRLGAASAPWIALWLKNYYVSAPFFVMGGLTLVASFLCFLLKETKGMATLEVLEQITTTEPGMEMTTKGGVSNEEEFAQRRHDEIGETKMNDDQGGLLVANKV